jgi:chloramphenicol 3-O phosphotransferase
MVKTMSRQNGPFRHESAKKEPGMSGRIVILNGTPRAGKSSIVAAMQQSLPGTWINLGVDAQNRMLPPHLLPGIGLRPGGERPDLEPMVVTLYQALYDAIAAHADRGLDVVADLGHHDFYSTPLGILPASARRLGGYQVLFVGVHCPIEIIMARRNADPQGGFYAGGDTVPEPVRRWQEAVHAHADYDITVDTGTSSPEQCVEAIAAALAQPPHPSAFERLAMSPPPSAP